MPGEEHDLGRILLIEDDPGDALMVREAFEQAGLRVRLDRSLDGDQALRQLRRGCAPRPALIMLDLGLPRRHGLEILADLKGDRHLRSIPVIVLSASRDPRHIRRSHDLGATTYIVKSGDFDGFELMCRQIAAVLGLAAPRAGRQS